MPPFFAAAARACFHILFILIYQQFFKFLSAIFFYHYLTEYKDIIERDGKKLQIIWKVTSNSEYGYPGLFDREVHKVIEQIITQLLKEKGKIENPIPLGSLYNICKKMGINNYGRHQYRKIKEAFRRIKTTSIETKGTFYSKDKKQWLEDILICMNALFLKVKK